MMVLNKLLNVLSPIYFSLCVLILILFLMVSVNSVVLNSDKNYNFLIYLYIFFSFVGVFFNLFTARILVYKHFLIFILFLFYFAFKAVFQYSDLSRFFSYSLGTSGGVVLFYFLGTFLTLNVIKNKRVVGFFSNKYWILIFCLVFLNLGLSLVLKNALVNVRSDIFLISDLEEGYQRAGDFLTILFFIGTIFVFFILKRVGEISVSFLVFCLYLIMLFLVGAISQIIGSNKGLVIPVLMCFSAFFIFLKDFKGRGKNIAKSFLLGGGGVILVYVFLKFDFSSLRVLGYGTGESSSLQSRYEIFVRNFYVHFTHSPYVGDLNVDTLLTGQGSYVHSFLFFTLTHFGIIGFLILSYYIFSCYRSIIGENEQLKLNKMIFIVILGISILSTAVFWPVIWFVMGVLCPAFLFVSRYKTLK